jgi:hypothetical protein
MKTPLGLYPKHYPSSKGDASELTDAAWRREYKKDMIRRLLSLFAQVALTALK